LVAVGADLGVGGLFAGGGAGDVVGANFGAGDGLLLLFLLLLLLLLVERGAGVGAGGVGLGLEGGGIGGRWLPGGLLLGN